jgi:hypothetical protein
MLCFITLALFHRLAVVARKTHEYYVKIHIFEVVWKTAFITLGDHSLRERAPEDSQNPS